MLYQQTATHVDVMLAVEYAQLHMCVFCLLDFYQLDLSIYNRTLFLNAAQHFGYLISLLNMPV